MSITIESALDDPAPRPLFGRFRPAALVALLLAEGLFLTIRFDRPSGLDTDRWWGWLLMHAREIGRLALLAVAMIATLGGPRLAIRVRRAFERDADGSHAASTWLLAHGISLAIFTVLASIVCEGGLATSSRPGAWVLASLVAGLATLATWSATLLSPSGWRTIARRGARPIAMGTAAAFVVFAASRYADEFWGSMAGTTMSQSRRMLSLVASNVTCDPVARILGIGDFKVRIAAVCSGFEGIGLVAGFLAVYLWRFRSSLRWPRAYLLLPAGVAMIWLLNACRIAALVLIGARVSPGVASGGFHSQAGWIAFLGVSLGLVAASRRSSFFAAEASDVAGPIGSNPTASFLGPFLAILATSMITGAFSSGFDAFYGLRALAGGLALWYFRRDFASLLGGSSWAGPVIGVVAFGLWAAFEPASTESSRMLDSTVGALPRGQAWAWVALRVIGSVAIVPLAEELAFRGYLTRRLIAIDFESLPVGQFSWLAWLLSSAAFGLLHGRWIAGTLVGLLYALAMYRRGKLGDAVVAHAVTNAMIAATVLATGDWSMWS